MMTRVLLVDGNRTHAEKTAKIMGQIKPDWRCLVVDSCREGRSLFSSFGPDAAVLKDGLKDGDAFELLHDFKAERPELPVIMMVPFDSQGRVANAQNDRAITMVPAQAPVGLLVLNLEMALEAAKYRPDQTGVLKTASTRRNHLALATLPVNRAIALYQPFDLFSLLPGGNRT
jgi:DNA-binding NtrC family response regulator